jgi:hypothetical protein
MTAPGPQSRHDSIQAACAAAMTNGARTMAVTGGW